MGYCFDKSRAPQGTLTGASQAYSLIGSVELSDTNAQTAAPVVSAAASVGSPLTVGPNPFERQTAVRYSLPATGHVSLSIHDVAGRLVRQLVSAQRAPAFVETFTVSARPTGPRSTELLLDWENTRVVVPILLAIPR